MCRPVSIRLGKFLPCDTEFNDVFGVVIVSIRLGKFLPCDSTTDPGGSELRVCKILPEPPGGGCG